MNYIWQNPSTDYRKAFDSVVHNELLCKLWQYGISGDLWNWIRAYLTNRIQCVRVDGQVSNLLPVVSGVPQGSLLGALFYISYSGLFSLGANFPEFSEWARDSGKFMLACL